ncbi:hypothetical protein [Cupriavidus sp. L7L]|nr:hypothetical protein [Cupriavidus sp. L7L]
MEQNPGDSYPPPKWGNSETPWLMTSFYGMFATGAWTDTRGDN